MHDHSAGDREGKTRAEGRLFVGYVTIEEWDRAIDRTEPVYACRFVHPCGTSPSAGPQVYELGVLVAQPGNDGLVHYWRFTAAQVTMLYDRPFDSEAAIKRQAHEDVWCLVSDWLFEHELLVREAAVGLPITVRVLSGKASFFAWSEEEKCYVRANTRSSPTAEVSLDAHP